MNNHAVGVYISIKKQLVGKIVNEDKNNETITLVYCCKKHVLWISFLLRVMDV